MSGAPARTFSEADKSQPSRSQHRNSPSTWSPHVSATQTASSSTTSPCKRPWESPPRHPASLQRQDSIELDELDDEAAPALISGRASRHHQRSAKQQTDQTRPESPSPKRSKRAVKESSRSKTPPHAGDTLAREQGGSISSKEATSQSASPKSRTFVPEGDRAEGSDSVGGPEQTLSPNEIDTFLDLIYKHHPDPMTAENMRLSVDAVYRDWEEFCARRQVPVTLDKKPLMDEYGKIFNGVYGPEYQAKAKRIANELSQRTANTSISGDEKFQRRRSSSRRSATRSSDDEDSDDEEADAGGATMGGDDDVSGVSPKKKSDAAGGDGAASSKKSNIAQVGRNGLAVLPPGLFDILRNHLRDDILSSIMPSVRNDLTEQTRELFLQNQDLFGRIKEMEDRIRNQDLWIRHLLAREPVEMAGPPIGPPAGTMGPVRVETNSRPTSYAGRDPTIEGRSSRHGPSLSESNVRGGIPMVDPASGPPLSPRQAARNEAKSFARPAMVDQRPWDNRSPVSMAGQTAAAGPNSRNVFGSGRWEAEPHHGGGYRDQRPPDGRSSQAHDFQRRPGSWQGERDRFRNQSGEYVEFPEGRYEPPPGVQSNDPRPPFIEQRRPSAMGGSRGPALASAPSHSTGSIPTMSGMHDEFRRPEAPGYARDVAMSPIEPAYDLRRPQPGFPGRQFEPYAGGPDSMKAPLPPRTGVAGSPEQIQKNKRGRPSKLEMANSRAELGPSSTHPRPYLS